MHSNLYEGLLSTITFFEMFYQFSLQLVYHYLHTRHWFQPSLVRSIHALFQVAPKGFSTKVGIRSWLELGMCPTETIDSDTTPKPLVCKCKYKFGVNVCVHPASFSYLSYLICHYSFHYKHRSFHGYLEC